jgi:hypothetical protein
MIKSFRLISILTLIILVGNSCKKTDNTIDTIVIDEVADDIAATLRASNSGLSSEIAMVTGLSNEYNSVARKSAESDTIFTVDTVITKSNIQGATILYNYTYQMNYGYVFNLLGTDNLFYSGEISGNFENRRIKITDERNSNWVVTGYENAFAEYILNGTTHRTGSTQSKVRNKSQMSSESQITLTNIRVNKSNQKITTGTMNWTITGEVNNIPYNYNATITYIGNDEIQLSLNDTIYIIDIALGEIN